MNAICLALGWLICHAGQLGGSPPDWIGREAWSEPPIRFRVVSSERWATPQEAQRDALDRAAQLARDYAAQGDSRIDDRWEPSKILVHDELVTQDYLEKIAWDYGPMYRAHLLLELSPENRAMLLADWEGHWERRQQEVANRRLIWMGAGLAFVIVCLATLFGYFRLDEATRGYYTPWLLTGASAVVTGTAAILYTLVTLVTRAA